jgi:hypothetical protein
MTSANPSFARQAEQRILRMTALLGFVAAAATALLWSPLGGMGVAIGAGLAWLSCLWLQQALDSLVQSTAVRSSSGGPSRPVRLPWSVAAKLAGRYALMAAGAYVTVSFFAVPVLSVLAGLLALGAAAMVEGVYEAVARQS